MRVRFDPDKAAECAARMIARARSYKGMRSAVIYGERWVSCKVRALNPRRRSATETTRRCAASAFADEPARLSNRDVFSEMPIETHGRHIVIDHGRVHLQSAHVFTPGLRASVGDFRTRPGDEVVYSAGEAGCVSVSRAEGFDHRDFASSSATRSRCREDGSILAMQPMINLNR